MLIQLVTRQIYLIFSGKQRPDPLSQTQFRKYQNGKELALRSDDMNAFQGPFRQIMQFVTTRSLVCFYY